MSARLSEASHIAGLLLMANGAMARGASAAEAAALIGVPVAVLREWREQLARAETRQQRRLARPSFPAFNAEIQPINASL